MQAIKQQLTNLTTSHAAAFVRIECIKVKYDRIMKHYVKNLRVLEFRLQKLLEAKEFAVADRDYARAEAVTQDAAQVKESLHTLQMIVDGHFQDLRDDDQGVKCVRVV